jgi:hypothetical protein
VRPVPLLVSAQSFAQLFRPQQMLTSVYYPATELTHPHFQAYGLGWFLQDYRGEFVERRTCFCLEGKR